MSRQRRRMEGVFIFGQMPTILNNSFALECPGMEHPLNHRPSAASRDGTCRF